MTAQLMTIRLMQNGVWTTVQGEGYFVGTPSVFVRVAGCNLRCSWCDTPASLPDYSMEANRFLLRATPKAVERTSADVAELVRLRMRTGVEHVVLTGGEPTLQQGADGGLCEMIDRLYDFTGPGVKNPIPAPIVTVETNCMLSPTPAFAHAVDFASLSPKVDQYNGGYSEQIQETYKAWADRMSKHKIQLKIVVASAQDVAQALVMFNELSHIAFPVWMGMQIESTWLRSGWLSSSSRIELCQLLGKAGIRLVAQMHPVLRVA